MNGTFMISLLAGLYCFYMAPVFWWDRVEWVEDGGVVAADRVVARWASFHAIVALLLGFLFLAFAARSLAGPI